MNSTRTSHKVLCIVLSVLMAFSVFSIVAAAADADAQTWTKVAFSEITSDDKIAITMTKDGTTWVLPAASTSSLPAAVVAAVEGDTLTTDAADYSWTVDEADGGYAITNADGDYLYTTAANNGVRVGNTEMVWNLDAAGYLKAVDSKNATRYLGVYITNPDWRAYTNTTGNTAGQTVGFWKLNEEPEAEPTGYIWTKTAFSEITSDDKIAITMTKGETTWVLPAAKATSAGPAAIAATVDGDTMTTDTADYRWTISEADGGYHINNADGDYLYLIKNNNNGVRISNTEAIWTLADGVYPSAPDTGGTVRYLGVYETKPDWRAYTNTTGNIAGQTVGFWKLTGAVYGDAPEAPVISTVAEALAGAKDAEFTVKAVITMIDGKNVYVQDETGGICLFFNSAVSDLALGDTVVFTGKRDTYKNLPELKGQTYEKSEGLTLTATETTLGALTAADVCTYVEIKDLTVSEVSGNSVNVTDAAGSSIQIYKAVLGDTVLAAGDVIDFKGAVGIFGEDLQLRNTVAEEITLHVAEEPATGLVTDLADLTDGAKVVIFNKANNIALSRTYTGNYNAGVAVTVTEDELTGYGATEIWTVGVNEDGTYTFSTADGNKLSMDTGYTSMPLDKVNDKWTVTAAGEDTFYIANVGREGYVMEWYASKTYWSCYNNGTTGDLFQQCFWLVGDEAPIEPDEPAAVVYEKLTAAPADGAKIVLHYPVDNMALTATASGKKLAGTAATPEGSKLTLTEDMAVLTVSEADGVFSFENNGKYLTSGATGNSLSFADELTDLAKWTVEAQDDGTFVIVNTTAKFTRNGTTYDQAMEYYSGFTTYNYTTATSAYKFDFYGEPEVKTGLVTDLADLTDGAKAVIFNKANAMALSQTYTGNYNAGVAVTLGEDGTLTGYGETEIWTVTVNEDGTYTFSTADGKKLSMDTSYSSMPLDKVNDKWTVTAVEGSTDGAFYIDNVGRTGYRMEWYASKSNWSTYYKENTGDLFQQYFYLVGDETPGGDTGETGDLVTDLSALTDGATVAIYSPGHRTAISSKPNGDWYLKAKDATLENGKVKNFSEDFVWTVRVNEDGTYSFYAYGDDTSSITVWKSDTYAELSLNLGKYPNNKWSLAPAKTANCFYISSPTVSGDKGPAYIEAYVRNGTEVFSGYFTQTTASNFSEGSFALQFYLVDPTEAIAAYDDGEWDGVLQKGASYVAYNASAEASIGLWDAANYSMKAIPTAIADGKAVPGNGAYVFTVDTMGRYYTFAVNGKFLATNPAEELFFIDPNEDGTAPEAAKWYLQAKEGGYIIYNKDVTYSGTPVCVEYYSSVFSGWTFSTKNEIGIYLFNFYEVAEGTQVYADVVQTPAVMFDCEDSRYFEQDYDVAFTLDDLAPEITAVEISVRTGDTRIMINEYTVSADGRAYSFTVPAADLDADRTAGSFNVEVAVSNSYGILYRGVKTVENRDEPFFTNLMPKPNEQTGEDKTPYIGAAVGNVGEDPEITMTLVYGEGEHPVQPQLIEGCWVWRAEEAMPDGRVTVHMYATRADGVSSEKSWSFTVGESGYKLYFGQLHSHTTYSDGSGDLETALDYVASLPDSANVDFVAFTDHSNYFDTATEANPADALNDKSLMTDASRARWETYKQTAAAFTAEQDDLIALAGFEMTWSGGPGHINTFDSDGLVSRNNTALNNKTGDAGMKLYYETINKGDSLNQFNHPGNTFGNFTDFSYRDDETDAHFFLVEVGNGEGQVGAGGYYPSYSEYDLALSKGWHVAPTNNQDNHKGRWGNANDARDVILAESFTEQGLYDAIRALRVYATEDKNLEIGFTVNDLPMGTIFGENTPETLDIVVTVYDPDATDAISKVELIGDEGKTVYTWSNALELAEGELKVSLAPEETYYYVRVTQKDGDLAVTAPVWVSKPVSAGVSAFTSDPETAVVNEAVTLTAALYNDEAADAAVSSVIYTADGEEIGRDTTAYTVPAGGSITVSASYVPTEAKRQTVTVTVVMTIDGKEHTYTKDLTLSVREHAGALDVTDIATVRANPTAGYEYAIEGVVTSNASGYDKDTAFFDCIYVQDETGGICCFPVSGEFKIGDIVRVEGYTDFYQGEPELQVTSIEVIGEGSVTPAEATAQQINDFSVRGDLVTVKGTVESFEVVNGLIQTIMVKDENGDICRVFIDGYITTAKEVEGCEVGANITVTGLASSDDTWPDTDYFARIRIRDRADVVCTPADNTGNGDDNGNGNGDDTGNTGDNGSAEDRICPLCGETHDTAHLRGWLISLIHDIIFIIKRMTQFFTFQW